MDFLAKLAKSDDGNAAIEKDLSLDEKSSRELGRISESSIDVYRNGVEDSKAFQTSMDEIDRDEESPDNDGDEDTEQGKDEERERDPATERHTDAMLKQLETTLTYHVISFSFFLSV